MADPDKTKKLSLPELSKQIQSLEKRITSLEDQLHHVESREYRPGKLYDEDSETDIHRNVTSSSDYNSNYESNVVEYGFAWISSIVFLFGVAFLMTYTRGLGYKWLATMIGYGGVFSMFILSSILKRSFPHLISAMQISGLFLLYYATLKLYFFTDMPFLESRGLALTFLLAVCAIHLYFGISRKKEFFTGLALVLLAATALFYDSTYISLIIISLIPATTLILFSRYGWWRLMLTSLFLVYFVHLIWYFNNPVMGHPFRAVETHQNNIVFLFIYAALFSATILVPRKKAISNSVLISVAIWNALCFSLLILLEVLSFYEDNYTWIFLLIAGLCISYSILLKKKTGKNFAPAFYACVGFLGLSIAVYGYEGIPLVYFFLALQSLLVVSMALWFRSQIIVVVNTLLFLIILMVYLFSASNLGYISFTFALVALVTARILNWKKERLTLKTELLRNSYLLAGFFTLLYGLYHTVPAEYITVSWTALALVFFIISVLLSNIKYRWLSILAILLSSIRLFIVDLARMDIGYRVIAFLVFAVIALSVSIYYTKKIKNKA